MNAPADHTHLDATYLPAVGLVHIQPSGSKTQAERRATFTDANLQELAATIRQDGLLHPLLLRPHPSPTNTIQYEIVAGERRYLAAGMAELASVPCMVRDLNDGQVLRMQVIENGQRENPSPLVEAAGYAEMMETEHLKAEEVGALVGRARAWVYSRINLLKLPDEVKAALRNGSIDVSRAMLVASVADPERQGQALKMALDRNQDNNPRHSVRQLRAAVIKDRVTIPLVGAPFPTDDEGLLQEKGACGPCRYRTGNCDPEATDPQLCTNAPCYHRKVTAYADRRRFEIKSTGGKVLKGEEARQLSPSVKTVYDHVDLDLVCTFDKFPEKEPDAPKGMQRYGAERMAWEANDPSHIAWAEREEAWQPRTYRALLEGEKYQSVLIDDPKTKALRELVPFKIARELLKQKGVDVPSWANKTRPKPVARSPQSQSSGNHVTPKEDAAAAKADKAKAELDGKIEAEKLLRVMGEVKARHSGALGTTELLYVAEVLEESMPTSVEANLLNTFGLTGTNWTKEVAKLPVKDLPRFVATALVMTGVSGNGYRNEEEAAEDILKALKIDPKKIEADVRKELTPTTKPSPNPQAKGAPVPSTKSAKKKSKPATPSEAAPAAKKTAKKKAAKKSSKK